MLNARIINIFHFVFITEKEIIISLLPIVLDNNRAPHLPHFLKFLESTTHQRITLDQWDSFLHFNHQIKEDMSNLEDDGACKFQQTDLCCGVPTQFRVVTHTPVSCIFNYIS